MVVEPGFSLVETILNLVGKFGGSINLVVGRNVRSPLVNERF